MSTAIKDDAPDPCGTEHNPDAYRDVLLAVRRTLTSSWDDDRPRIAVIERDGVCTVYVSTTRHLEPPARLGIRSTVRAALAPFTSLAPSTDVIFLRRARP